MFFSISKVHCPTCNQNTKTKLKLVNDECYTPKCLCFSLIIFGLFHIVLAITSCFYSTKRECLISIFVGFAFVSAFAVFCAYILLCDFCKNIEHHCSVCDTYLGRYEGDRKPVVILPPELYKDHVAQPNNN
ncbi:unnamed protein product [Meloidogyne enterolobii]|uniref:Uncharacterized protein n=1 Tax=Meloidogyne enterolobii TaxID=390850 RepID=A0ACB1AJ10_MELEN